jgi:hemerythrin
MTRIEWTEALSVGNSGVDEQHRQIIALINRFEDSVRDSVGAAAVRTCIDGLVDYAVVHFRDEEAILDSLEFPSLAKHKLFHQYFVARVKVFSERFASGEPDVPEDLLTFLKLWLVDHIMVSDQEYAAYITGAKHL